MLTSLPGIGADDQVAAQFSVSEVYALLVLVGLFGFVVNDLFAVIEGGPLATMILIQRERGTWKLVFPPYTLDLCESWRSARPLHHDRHRRHAG